MKKLLSIILLTVVFLFISAVQANAVSTLFGSAVNDGGIIKTVSDWSVPSTPDDDYGAVSFDDANSTLFSNLTVLSADYNVTDDDCGGGSPRFSIRMDTDGDTVSNGNIFVYMGPLPNFTGCVPNSWINTGNLVGSTDARFDLSQLGGPWYGTYANALSLVGSGTILRISLVTDGGWQPLDKEQEVWFDNVIINEASYDFTLLSPVTKEECKNEGWMLFNNPFFKNQGDCVSYIQSNEHAVGNKTK